MDRLSDTQEFKSKDPLGFWDKIDPIISERRLLRAIFLKAYEDSFGNDVSLLTGDDIRQARGWFRSRSKSIGSWLWIAEALSIPPSSQRYVERSVGRN